MKHLKTFESKKEKFKFRTLEFNKKNEDIEKQRTQLRGEMVVHIIKLLKEYLHVSKSVDLRKIDPEAFEYDDRTPPSVSASGDDGAYFDGFVFNMSIDGNHILFGVETEEYDEEVGDYDLTLNSLMEVIIYLEGLSQESVELCRNMQEGEAMGFFKTTEK